MTDLVAYKVEDGVELFINSASVCFVRQSGLARICGVSRSTLSRYLSDVSPLLVDTLTSNGFQSVALYNEDTMLTCIVKYNPRLIPLVSANKFRAYLHSLVGY